MEIVEEASGGDSPLNGRGSPMISDSHKEGCLDKHGENARNALLLKQNHCAIVLGQKIMTSAGNSIIFYMKAENRVGKDIKGSFLDQNY